MGLGRLKNLNFVTLLYNICRPEQRALSSDSPEFKYCLHTALGTNLSD